MMTELLGAIKELTESAARKADENYRVAMLKISIATLKKLLAGQYRELGAAVYGMCKNGEGDSKEIAAMTVQIDGTKKRIAAAERRIDDILGLIKCPRCGNTVKMKYAYCSRCGKKLASEVEGVFENENEMNIQDMI